MRIKDIKELKYKSTKVEDEKKEKKASRGEH